MLGGSDPFMWFVRLSATPLAESQEFAEFGGAYVNCWLDMPERDAMVRASELIKSYGWQIETIEESRPVAIESYEPESEGSKYFKQAQVDREVVVFHSWSNNANDRGGIQ